MLSEMVATRHRGALVATLNIGSGGVGNFLSYGLFFLLLGPLAPALGGDQEVWRWTFLLLALPALLVVFYRRLLPETPRFLLSKGRIDEANRSLAILTSDSLRPPAGPAPTGPLTTADIPPRQLASSPAAVFARPVLPRTLAIGAASWMAFGSQVTLNFLMPTLLVERGYSISDSLLFTMIMNVGSLLGACAAALLAGRVGRRDGRRRRRRAGLPHGRRVRGVRRHDRADPAARRALPVLHDDHQHHARRVVARAVPDRDPRPRAPRSSTASATSPAR